MTQHSLLRGESRQLRLRRVLIGAIVCTCALNLPVASAQTKEKNPLEGKKGRVIGVVTKKGKNFIEVKAFGEEKARKYFPQWKGGLPAQGGGFDKNTLAAFKKVGIGGRVEINWLFQERLRVVKLKILSKGKIEKDRKEKKDRPGGKRGFLGLVRAKLISKNADKDSFKIKVEKVVKLFRGNRAEPETVAGKTLTVFLNKGGRLEKMRERLATLKTGETIVLGLAQREGRFVQVEGLRKAEVD